VSANKCECGGALKPYDGALGFEAMECRKCGYQWSGRTRQEHELQLQEYRRIVQANAGNSPEVRALIQAAEGMCNTARVHQHNREHWRIVQSGLRRCRVRRDKSPACF
jgi:hypothetical protein